MMSDSLQFSFDRQPLGEAEVAVLGPSAGFAGAMNALVATGDPAAEPRILRARRAGRVVGAAILHRCTRTMEGLLGGRLGAMADLARTPVLYWSRAALGVDLMGCPGLLADGEDPAAFYREAIAWLGWRSPVICVHDAAGEPPASACVETPFADSGFSVPGGVGDPRELLATHKNLRRKVSRFQKRGGRIERVFGALPDDTAVAVRRCLDRTRLRAMVQMAVQRNYEQMVDAASRGAVPDVVHLVCRVGEDVVGYHSFMVLGQVLTCLSGAFDRDRDTNHHAYENLILDAVRLAGELGLTRVEFGPVLNPTKASMMGGFERSVMRFYVPGAVGRLCMRSMLPYTSLATARMAPWVGLQPRAASGDAVAA